MDDEYAVTRRVWNGMIDKKPALIARCASAADVRAGVKLARAERMTISVRGGLRTRFAVSGMTRRPRHQPLSPLFSPHFEIHISQPLPIRLIFLFLRPSLAHSRAR